MPIHRALDQAAAGGGGDLAPRAFARISAVESLPAGFAAGFEPPPRAAARMSAVDFFCGEDAFEDDRFGRRGCFGLCLLFWLWQWFCHDLEMRRINVVPGNVIELIKLYEASTIHIDSPHGAGGFRKPTEFRCWRVDYYIFVSPFGFKPFDNIKHQNLPSTLSTLLRRDRQMTAFHSTI
jgi:hypothetical protein